MEIRKLTGNPAELSLLEAINEEAFPEEERCALRDLLASGAEVWRIGAEGDPAGFIVVRIRNNIVYLAYLAIRADLRSGGIGGEALRELIRMNPDKQVVVEFEAPDERCADNPIRIRRKGFYLRNGFYETGWYTRYDGTEFEIGCSRPDFDSEGFLELSAWLAGRFSDHIPDPFQK